MLHWLQSEKQGTEQLFLILKCVLSNTCFEMLHQYTDRLLCAEESQSVEF